MRRFVILARLNLSERAFSKMFAEPEPAFFLECYSFNQFHHLEEVGLGILQIVHHTILAVLAEGGFQDGHLVNQMYNENHIIAAKRRRCSRSANENLFSLLSLNHIIAVRKFS